MSRGRGLLLLNDLEVGVHFASKPVQSSVSLSIDLSLNQYGHVTFVPVDNGISYFNYSKSL